MMQQDDYEEIIKSCFTVFEEEFSHKTVKPLDLLKQELLSKGNMWFDEERDRITEALTKKYAEENKNSDVEVDELIKKSDDVLKE